LWRVLSQCFWSSKLNIDLALAEAVLVVHLLFILWVLVLCV